MSSDEEFEEDIPDVEEEEEEDDSSSSSSDDLDILFEDDKPDELEIDTPVEENINVKFHPRVCTRQALTALVTERAKHLSMGKKPMLPTYELKSLRYNNLAIAEKEIKEKLVNFVIRYTNPSGELVEVDSNTLIF